MLPGHGDSKAVREVNFILSGGAVGDYCAWMSALKWIRKTQPHVAGRIFAPDYFLPIPKHIFKHDMSWKVFSRNELTPGEVARVPTFIPDLRAPINATGAHLIDMGFIYYTNMTPPPKDARHYVRLDLSDVRARDDLPERYAVITPLSTTPLRALPGVVFNRICEHLRSRKITPVFLGYTEMAPKHRAEMVDGCDLTLGVNLIGHTSLLEAAKIIDQADLIVGMDNGLLHLAGMTDTPIVYGHNIIHPELRAPLRRSDSPIVHLTPSLGCRFCKSTNRFRFDPNVETSCDRGDRWCLNEVGTVGLTWEESIDYVLKSAPNRRYA